MDSGQGIEEFKNEIEIISRLQHKNLVRILGCCIEGGEMLIVYEYMPNKSLDTFLFDKRAELDWANRFNIIQGIARGLLYLHRGSCLKIIHQDIKVSNILLDEDMNPIFYFGLTRKFICTQELANTHRVAGTFGYMSYEYAMGGMFLTNPISSALESYYWRSFLTRKTRVSIKVKNILAFLVM